MTKKDNDAKTKLLGEINTQVHDKFIKQKHILTFNQFFELFYDNPTRFTRTAYQYIIDMIEHFGQRKDENGNEINGFKVFDLPFNGGKGAVKGQERAQHEIFSILKGFDRGGRADKLILLHGPNGSAKTSLVGCLMKGLEEYSKCDEGALYRFNWIFPEERLTRETIGFTKENRNDINQDASYANLPEDRIAATITSPLRDSPLDLIPEEDKEKIFTKLRKKDKKFAKHQLSDVILENDLSPKNKQIFNALLAAYGGDYAKIMQHIQVERYYISERYKTGAATIEPQMSVDAHIQQLTADRSLSSLPPVLQNLSLYEASGHLVQGNHGIVEYSDLLKRPLDSFKYLLGTCEKGTINLDIALIYLDLLLVGSSNDKYIEAFKQQPDFTSFKARMEFVRVPYLLDFTKEKDIYEEQLSLDTAGKPLSPHLTEIVALWAVLTRLMRPKSEKYSDELKNVIEKMTPLDKAMFYSFGQPPDGVSVAQAKELMTYKMKMFNEHAAGPRYEGSFGASPREAKMVLRNAAQNASDACISFRHIIGEISRLISDVSVYEWLQYPPDGDFCNQKKLLDFIQDYYIRKVDNELKIAMEMIEETQYVDLLERYVAQASAWIHKKKVVDPVSEEEKPVDIGFLKEIESIIAKDDKAEEFRQDVVSRVGAFALDNPSEQMNYTMIFISQIKKLEQHYFTKQQIRVSKLHENMMRVLSDRAAELPEKDVKEVNNVLDRMQTRFGYHPDCTREAIMLLMRTRYSPKPAEPKPVIPPGDDNGGLGI